MARSDHSPADRPYSFHSSISEESLASSLDTGDRVRWYFDALSDDGREALVIVFHDVPDLSTEHLSLSGKRTTNGLTSVEHARGGAITFGFYRDGQSVCSTVYHGSFLPPTASEGELELAIGRSSFIFRAAPYGDGFFVELDLDMSGGRVKAELEWLAIECDLQPAEARRSTRHDWNMAVPRADVSGRIEVHRDRGGKPSVSHFRGTGYHDRRSFAVLGYESIPHWFWARAHFSASTAVIYETCKDDAAEPNARFFCVQNGEIRESAARMLADPSASKTALTKKEMSFRISSDDGRSVLIKPSSLIKCGERYDRYVAEFEISEASGETHSAKGLVETLSRRVWFSRLRQYTRGFVGRN